MFIWTLRRYKVSSFRRRTDIIFCCFKLCAIYIVFFHTLGPLLLVLVSAMDIVLTDFKMSFANFGEGANHIHVILFWYFDFLVKIRNKDWCYSRLFCVGNFLSFWVIIHSTDSSSCCELLTISLAQHSLCHAQRRLSSFGGYKQLYFGGPTEAEGAMKIYEGGSVSNWNKFARPVCQSLWSIGGNVAPCPLLALLVCR